MLLIINVNNNVKIQLALYTSSTNKWIPKLWKKNLSLKVICFWKFKNEISLPQHHPQISTSNIQIFVY